MDSCEPSEPRNSPKSSQEARCPSRVMKYVGKSQISLLVSDKSGQNPFSFLDEDAFSLDAWFRLLACPGKKKKKTDCDMKCERIQSGREEGTAEKNECKCCKGGREVGDIRVKRRANCLLHSRWSLIGLELSLFLTFSCGVCMQILHNVVI